ncbi:hypothetical protein N7456_007787 [Penicillium angulare]|uniref:Uncharacterized protein n=1 Tax=Penicillium angulare TaxID=116970 RepID=A0A9W9K927_9EURO|nr:hypothetical protein N7456_007787 [Penicillium angulare]
MTSNWSDEVVEHRGKAAQLLENALRTIQSQNSLHLLEPILILFTLDCTLSATGQWNTHLKRAHSVLQACGGPNSLIAPRQRSQVGMLLWWDATITLVSRRCPIFDRSYLEYCIRWEKLDEWSFFDLTGCPQELFVLLYNLSELAQQSEIASSMTWLTFNITPIIEAEEKLNQWQNKFVPLPQDQNLDISDEDLERQLHEQQDRYHCAEAWRCALILYIESVFKRDSSQRRSFSLTLMARKTLDHIRCCRRTSQTQKQLLLPIFLAGSETYDNDMRNFVKDYCLYWAEKSRYSMFSSVPMLLEEIWTTDQWWGAIIDSKRKASTQLLLG